MKNRIHRLLITALMISCIGTVDAAQTNEKTAPRFFGTGKKEKAVKTKPGKPAEQAKKGWSVKAKVITALGIVATGIGLYIAWRRYTATDNDFEILKKFERNEANAEKYQIPAGRAGRLMHHVLALYEPCQEAMRNAQSQANIEALFNNEEFIALMNHERFGYICEVRINALFNDRIIVQASTQPDFIERTLIMLRASTVDREINSIENRVFND